MEVNVAPSKSISLRKRILDPAIHRYTKFGRTIIRSKNGANNVKWILDAQTGLKYPLNHKESVNLLVNKNSFYLDISGNCKLFVFTLAADSRYYLTTAFVVNQSTDALILVDEKPNENTNFSSLGILLPNVRPKTINGILNTRYNLTQFKRLMAKFYSFEVESFEDPKIITPNPPLNENPGRVSRLMRAGRGLKRAFKRNVLGMSTSMSKPKHSTLKRIDPTVSIHNTVGSAYIRRFGSMNVICSDNGNAIKYWIDLAKQNQLELDDLRETKFEDDDDQIKPVFYASLKVFVIWEKNLFEDSRINDLNNSDQSLVLVDTEPSNITDYSSVGILLKDDLDYASLFVNSFINCMHSLDTLRASLKNLDIVNDWNYKALEE